MVIAIDLDGVIFDTEEYFRTYGQIYDMEIVKNGLITKNEINLKKRHNWDSKTADEFFEKYTAEVFTKAPVKPGVKYVINELKKQGHKLVCITLRGYYRKCEKEITEQRLQQENILFDKIIYSQEYKVDACKQENVEIMLEDNPNNIESLIKNDIKCIYFRTLGLKEINSEKVFEVQNWAQAYDVLKNINN